MNDIVDSLSVPRLQQKFGQLKAIFSRLSIDLCLGRLSEVFGVVVLVHCIISTEICLQNVSNPYSKSLFGHNENIEDMVIWSKI